MDLLRKFFPYSFRANDVAGLIVTILVYIVADVVCGFAIGLLSGLPLIGIVIGLVGSLLGIYFFAGIVIAVLHFLKVLK